MTAGRTGEGGPTRRTLATRTYVGCVAAAAALLLVVGQSQAGMPYDIGACVLLSVLAISGWLLREGDVGHRVQISSASIILLASAVIVGPVGSGIVGLVSSLPEWRRVRPVVCMFNAAMNSVIGSVGGLVYFWLAGPEAIGKVHGAVGVLWSIGVPLLVADIAQCITNAILLSGVMWVSAGVPVRTQVVKLLSTTGIAYVSYGVIGMLFVVLWIPAKVGWFSGVLVLAPLFVARWAFVQYGDELRAHERTLRALVTAEETKEPRNAGHSERVAQLCEWLAEVLGLGHKEIQDVRTAGMLHDVGKVGVPTRLLTGRRELSDDDLVVVASHAHRGVELIEDIDFLAGSIDGIAHHHERFDGRGYPAGLAGTDIPLSARIVAAADLFDSLTTARSYRPALEVPEALGVLRDRAGTQLDPQVVEALERVLARHEWTPTQHPDDFLAAGGTVLDHDEPEISDLFASRADLRERIRTRTTRQLRDTSSRERRAVGRPG